MYTVKFTHVESKRSVTKGLTDKQLASLAVDLTGGGITVQDTTNAMFLLFEIKQGRAIDIEKNGEVFTMQLQG